MDHVGNSTSNIQGTPRLALDISAINPPGLIEDSSIFDKTDDGGFDELLELDERGDSA